MINKIQITGKLVLSSKQKEDKENIGVIDEIHSANNFTNNFSSDVRYYNIMVTIPNGSVTLIRCMLKHFEKIEKWEKELKDGDVVTIRGFLRNEINGRQIMVKIADWEKVDEEFEKLDIEKNNIVRLIGRVIDLKKNEDDEKNLSSFRVCCQSWWHSSQPSFNLSDNNSNSESNGVYFCRINETEMKNKTNIQKNDVVWVEGFLQTKKIFNEDKRKIESRISTIICQAIKILDSLNSKFFYPWDDMKLIKIPVKKIDFSKPKP